MTIYSIAKPAPAEEQGNETRVEFYLCDRDGDLNLKARNLETGQEITLAWKQPEDDFFLFLEGQLPSWLGLRQPSDGPLFE